MRKKQFKAESKKLLDMMINSIYTNKEIFLRELISNASDAIDKLYFKSLTDTSVGMNKDDFEIFISADKEARTLTISDNGIGMTADELESNLGTIAKSGSLNFKNENEDAKEKDIEVIGQFGVGFYSSFMVAKKVEVVSKAFGEDVAHKWTSEGADGYTLEECEKENVGTVITLYMKDDTETEDYSRFLEQFTITELVKKYSDYIRYPIKMETTHSVPDSEKEGEYKEETAVEILNSMVPLWRKNKNEISTEEYNEFYKSRFTDYHDPLDVIHFKSEGTATFDSIIYIPSAAPFDFYSKEYEKGLALYTNGVMIMEKCADLVPDYFSFVKGVVDSEDLSLNISRETLQKDNQLKLMRNSLEKKIKNELHAMLVNDREKYETFWKNFGRQLKYGAVSEYGAHKELLQDLLLFYSSTEKKLVTLAEYVGRMKEDQKFIYYASGDTVEAIDHMPQTELLKEHSMEILYFTDKADEFLADILRTYQDKPFRSAIDGDLELGDAQKPDETEHYKDAFDFIKETLGGRVDTVKASTKLKTHPVCLTSGEGVTFEMEKYFTAVQPELGLKAKRILEINVDHPAFLAFEAARVTDPEKAKKYAEILYNQAVLIAGMPIEDPSSYTDLLCSLWQ